MVPTFQVVRGESLSLRAANRAITALIRTIGFGIPASVQECPPGAEIVTRNRRLPSASVTATSCPAPSKTMFAAIRFRQSDSW